MIQLNHIGVVNSSRDEAIRFYRDFLGLDVVKDAIVPVDLSKQLFGIPRDITMIVFQKNTIKIEVFIISEYSVATPNVTHAGLMVDALDAMKKRARQSGIEVITGRTEEKTVHFIKDFSGNLIEVKQKDASS